MFALFKPEWNWLTKRGARIWFHLNFRDLKSLSLNYVFFFWWNGHLGTLITPFTVIMNGIHCIWKLLTNYILRRILKEQMRMNILNHVIFPSENTNIETYRCTMSSECKYDWYYRVIALILRNIVPSSISYGTSLRVQFDILRGTIFLNISAITLL